MKQDGRQTQPAGGIASSPAVFTNGEQIFSHILGKIRSARQSLRVNAFIWRDDAIGRRVAEEILAAADRGVAVDIRKDRIGMIYEKAEENRQSLLHKELAPTLWWRQKLVDWFYPAPGKAKTSRQHPSELSRRLVNHPNIRISKDVARHDHAKFFIFDDECLLLGGINIEEKFITQDAWSRPWIDYLVEIRGDDIIRHFLGRFDRAEPARLDDSISFIVNRYPHQFEAKDLFLDMLSSTQRELLIEMAYFDSPEIAEQITALVRRGVSVVIVAPRHANVHDDLNHRWLRDLMLRCDNRVELHMVPQMLHAKLFMIDAETLVVGSTNFTHLSFTGYSEVSVVLRGHKTCNQTVLSAVREHIEGGHRIADADALTFNPLRARLEAWGGGVSGRPS